MSWKYAMHSRVLTWLWTIGRGLGLNHIAKVYADEIYGLGCELKLHDLRLFTNKVCPGWRSILHRPILLLFPIHNHIYRHCCYPGLCSSEYQSLYTLTRLIIMCIVDSPSCFIFYQAWFESYPASKFVFSFSTSPIHQCYRSASRTARLQSRMCSLFIMVFCSHIRLILSYTPPLPLSLQLGDEFHVCYPVVTFQRELNLNFSLI